MGCDIHGWIEIKKDDRWIAIEELRDEGQQRNYHRFAKLAGVRDCDNYREGGQGIIPKGLPVNMSETTKYWSDYWGSDGHSHSYIELKEAAKIFLETDYKPRDYAKKYPLGEYFNFDEECHAQEEARLVFWFDN